MAPPSSAEPKALRTNASAAPVVHASTAKTIPEPTDHPTVVPTVHNTQQDNRQRHARGDAVTAGAVRSTTSVISLWTSNSAMFVATPRQLV
jgi:hypothetical protein